MQKTIVILFFLASCFICHSQNDSIDKIISYSLISISNFKASIDTLYNPRGNSIGIRLDTAFFDKTNQIVRFVSNRQTTNDIEKPASPRIPSFELIYTANSYSKAIFFNSLEQTKPEIYYFYNGMVKEVINPQILVDTQTAYAILTDNMRKTANGQLNVRWEKLGSSGVTYLDVNDEHPNYLLFKKESRIIQMPKNIRFNIINLFESDSTSFDKIYNNCPQISLDFIGGSFEEYFRQIGIESIIHCYRITEVKRDDQVLLKLNCKAFNLTCNTTLRLMENKEGGNKKSKLISVQNECY